MTDAEIEAVKAALLPLVNDEQDTNMLEAWLFDLARTAIAALDRVRATPADPFAEWIAPFVGDGKDD